MFHDFQFDSRFPRLLGCIFAGYAGLEVDEAMYPILFEERRIAIDTLGPGQWCGAPATGGSYRSLTGDIVVYYCGDGGTFPAQGVLGGGAGATCGSWKRHGDRRLERLPDFHLETFTQGQAVVFRCCAGGGYGAPIERDPNRVALDVNRKWLSQQRAAEVFGVALKLSANGVDHEVDRAKTEELRKAMQGAA